jgi:uncharacterized phiE125 gp8 family phage protein
MTIRLEPSKRADEVRRYRHEWAPFLGGDTIVSEVTTGVGVVIDDHDIEAGDQSVVFTVSGGTDGTPGIITHSITTVAGDEETETFVLVIDDQSEPISLQFTKCHLRVKHDDEDALILSYIRTAREWVETFSGHILVRREITQVFSQWHPYLELFYRPVTDDPITISYQDEDDVTQTLTEFAQTTGRHPFRIYPEESPTILDRSSITVTFTAGYAQGYEPQLLIQAMLILISAMYDNRGSIPETASDTAAGLCNKLAPLVF